MADILIKNFPMPLNGRWGTFSDHIVIHGNGSVTYTDGHNFENAKAMEVVRCKNCKHFLPPHACLHDNGMITAQENGFCSHGERRK